MMWKAPVIIMLNRYDNLRKNETKQKKKTFVSPGQRDTFSKVLLGPVMWLHNTNLHRAVNLVAASGVSIMGATGCMGIV